MLSLFMVIAVYNIILLSYVNKMSTINLDENLKIVLLMYHIYQPITREP